MNPLPDGMIFIDVEVEDVNLSIDRHCRENGAEGRFEKDKITIKWSYIILVFALKKVSIE